MICGRFVVQSISHRIPTGEMDISATIDHKESEESTLIAGHRIGKDGDGESHLTSLRQVNGWLTAFDRAH
jgi:hypothetical protein